jgi:hypothetical protein
MAGLAAGLLGAARLTRGARSVLYAVRPLEPLTYAAVAGALAQRSAPERASGDTPDAAKRR